MRDEDLADSADKAVIGMGYVVLASPWTFDAPWTPTGGGTRPYFPADDEYAYACFADAREAANRIAGGLAGAFTISRIDVFQVVDGRIRGVPDHSAYPVRHPDKVCPHCLMTLPLARTCGLCDMCRRTM